MEKSKTDYGDMNFAAYTLEGSDSLDKDRSSRYCVNL